MNIVSENLKKANKYLGAVLLQTDKGHHIRYECVGKVIQGVLVNRMSDRLYFLLPHEKGSIDYNSSWYEENYYLVGNCKGTLIEFDSSNPDHKWALVGCPRRTEALK